MILEGDHKIIDHIVMTLNKDKPKDGFERVVYAEEDKFNFYSVIAIHNTKRPCLGG